LERQRIGCSCAESNAVCDGWLICIM